MATYDTNQIVFCLSTLSNLSSSYSGSGDKIEKEIKPQIKAVFADPTVQGLIGTWDLVWGPVVDVGPFRVGGDLAINTMYIAQSVDNPAHFVVGIAGTDASSKYDWIVEDFWVGKTVTWPYLPAGWPTQPQISDGTNYGLGKLVAMKDPDTGLTAREYLQNNAANTSGSIVAVTGHSLGGALSPSYALYLNDTASEWNSAGNTTIMCLATAGPTPGDSDFSEYYGSRLGSATTRVWNSHDVVPHAWQADMLSQIPTLYVPIISPDIEINAFVALAKWVSRNTPYTQLLPDTAGSPSNVVGVPAGNSFTGFMQELCYQHIDNYVTIFAIQAYQAAVTQVLNTGKTFFSCNLTQSDIDSVTAIVQRYVTSESANAEATTTPSVNAE